VDYQSGKPKKTQTVFLRNGFFPLEVPLADFDMFTARSRAFLARLAVDLTIFVTESSFLAGDVTSANLSGTGVGFVEGSGFVESRFGACFLPVEASPFGFEDFGIEEDLEGDSLTSLVSVSTFRFFFGGFSCSGALLEGLGSEEGFDFVSGFSA